MSDIGQIIGILRCRERGVVNELKLMEAECPNGRDYERSAEFDTAYQDWQEKRAALEEEKAKIVAEYRALYTDRFGDRKGLGRLL